MGVWCIVVLSVISSVVANEHPPNNSSFPPEEFNATAESGVLERVELLLQTLSAKINVLDDGIVDMKRDIGSLFVVQNETKQSVKIVSEKLESYSFSAIRRLREQKNVLERLNKTFSQRMIKLEKKLDTLPEIIRDTNQTSKTRNDSLSQRIINLEHKMERFPADTGVYLMQPDPSMNVTFEVFRDMTNYDGFGGDWIMFQRRFNGSVNFYRNWTEYKNGFGDLRGEHWLGLDKLHSIVKPLRHELLVVLEDFDGVIKYAHYDNFKIGDESEKYVLKSVGRYNGTAGNSFTQHKDASFSTYDQDNDQHYYDCSEEYEGAWWFGAKGFCLYSHLNGPYLKGETDDNNEGVNWNGFRGEDYSLTSSKMMVRPVV